MNPFYRLSKLLKPTTGPVTNSCHCPRAAYDVSTPRGIVHHDLGVTHHRGNCWLAGKTTESNGDS